MAYLDYNKSGRDRRGAFKASQQQSKGARFGAWHAVIFLLLLLGTGVIGYGVYQTTKGIGEYSVSCSDSSERIVRADVDLNKAITVEGTPITKYSMSLCMRGISDGDLLTIDPQIRDIFKIMAQSLQDNQPVFINDDDFTAQTWLIFNEGMLITYPDTYERLEKVRAKFKAIPTRFNGLAPTPTN